MKFEQVTVVSEKDSPIYSKLSALVDELAVNAQTTIECYGALTLLSKRVQENLADNGITLGPEVLCKHSEAIQLKDGKEIH